jgi:putative phosphoribosyl transferase
LLAERLSDYRGRDVVVLGLPRGGVAVARPIADALGAPLDVIVARKLGAPDNPEFAIGAVTAKGTRVLNDVVLRRFLLPPDFLASETRTQQDQAMRRERALRGLRSPERLEGRVVILVDDGIATGMTMKAAIADVVSQDPAEVVIAAPVIAPDTFEDLVRMVGEVVALDVPFQFHAVGAFYQDFTQVEDEEVQRLLSVPVR